MRGPAFYAPRRVPPRVAAFDSEPGQLGVGKAGKCGLLQASFRLDGGRTVLGGAYAEAPLHVQRVLRPGGPLAHLYVASASGGVLQGDRYRVDLELGGGAMAHVTTQGATRVYGMDANCATQVLNVRLADGAYLELVPGQIIPYRGSRFYQEASLEVHSGAAMAYSEILTPGRSGMGESFEYDACCLRMEARDESGAPRMSDAAYVEPGRRAVSGFGAMGGRRVVGTVYVLAPPRHVGRLRGEVGAAIRVGGVSGGATVTRGGAGLLVRLLGDRADRVAEAVRGAVGAVRERVAGAPFEELAA